MKCMQGDFGHITCDREAMGGESYCVHHLPIHLRKEVADLRMRLNTCKNDYWFMTNLLEKYSTDKQQAIADCIERMKFRKGLFSVLGEKQ